MMILIPFISYQGFCHVCQMGYYYPGGDCMAPPEDERPLKCALCKGKGLKADAMKHEEKNPIT
jgi:hypothetical protein